MPNHQWITHRGQRMLLVDFAHCGTEVSKVLLARTQLISLVIREPRDSVRSLVQIEGTQPTPEIFAVLRDTAKQMAPYVHCRAIVGLSAPQRLFLNLINQMAGSKQFHVFETLAAAQDWLADFPA